MKTGSSVIRDGIRDDLRQVTQRGRFEECLLKKRKTKGTIDHIKEYIHELFTKDN